MPRSIRINIVSARTVVFLLLPNTAVVAGERPNILWSVDWSSDEESFAVAGEKTLWIYDARSFTRHFALPISDTARAVSWHPSWKLLAVAASPQDTTGIFDTELNLMVRLNTASGGRDIAWNSDGTRLATAGHDGSMQI